MKSLDLNNMLKKVDEYQLIPFLEELIAFVRQIKPVLEDINSSVTENIVKMPNATKKLSQVTEATELATNEIMNIVDSFVQKIDHIKDVIVKYKEERKTRIDLVLRLLYSVRGLAESPEKIKELLPEINKTISIIESITETETAKDFDNIYEVLSEFENDSTSIMMSLQVQDITSQQIAAVNHLLNNIQSKLAHILQWFDSSDQKNIPEKSTDDHGTNVSTLHRTIAFDPDAVNALTTEDRQDKVDDLFQKHNDGTISEDDMKEESMDDEISLDDIDALFAGGGNEEEDEEHQTFSPGEEKAEEDDGDMSQDDIDALFG